jgi:hypothetical protein
MNNSLERLVEGIVLTLRVHVIPNVSDAYARGQAIGVIDLLNNIAPRLEWARAPIAEAVAERRKAIADVRALLPEAPPAVDEGFSDQALVSANSTVLAAERDRLDSEIADLIAWTHGGEARGDIGAAIALLRRHVHDALAREMKMTKKPLFAEIAKGVGDVRPRDQV